MLKLYLWEMLDSISSYGPGMAFALANTKEEAIERIMSDGEAEPIEPDRLRDELMRVDPAVVESPKGFSYWGSD